MARGKTLSVVFKAHRQHQIMAFPPSREEWVPADHPVRVVHEVLEKVDITALLQQYKPGGTSSYHPRLLLKALVYGYVNNIYSRKIEEALQRDIHFMWLTGMSKPDHNTINRFRGQRLQKTLQPVFTQVVLLLCEEGLLSLKDLYTDGTKIEDNANRYTFVGDKAIKISKERISQQLDELWKYAQSVAADELERDKLRYDKDKDRYYCPAGKPMKNIGSFIRTTKTKAAIPQTLTRYQAKNCAGCSLRKECHPREGNRIIEVNHNLNRLRQQADKRLKPKRGIQKRKQRCFDTEPVFANIKHNHHLRPYL